MDEYDYGLRSYESNRVPGLSRPYLNDYHEGIALFKELSGKTMDKGKMANNNIIKLYNMYIIAKHFCVILAGNKAGITDTAAPKDGDGKQSEEEDEPVSINKFALLCTMAGMCKALTYIFSFLMICKSRHRRSQRRI
jgi:hypothetical protein